MKKILFALTCVALLSTIIIGCKGKDSVNGGDPKTVLIAFFERMSKKDLEGAAKLATKDSKSTMEMMKKAMDMGETMKDKMGDGKVEETDPAEEFKNMKIGEAKIDGDNATVSVSNPSKDDRTFDFPLKKEEGLWKVDFSMSTLMKMGMNEANKNMNNNNFDTEGDEYNPMDTSFSMEQLNKLMNSDSLKMGLEKLDSMMKTIDPEKMKELKDAMNKMKNETNQ